jgi:hypothetical protein
MMCTILFDFLAVDVLVKLVLARPIYTFPAAMNHRVSRVLLCIILVV